MNIYKSEREHNDRIHNGVVTNTFTYCCLQKPDGGNYIYNRYIALEKIGEEDINSLSREEVIFLLSYAHPMFLKNIHESMWFTDLYSIAKTR